jgi:nucleoid-associated protein YgaU
LILLVGNTPGVEKVEDAIKVRPPGATADVSVPAPKLYTVKSGDTLGSIARSQLGNESRYQEIFNANRHLLSNPDAIDVGQTLRIPS